MKVISSAGMVDKNQVVIEAVGICKEYDTGKIKTQALHDIHLAIQYGEVVAIMGPSGCGKTTLLNCLSGLDKTTAGTIKIAGQPIDRLPDRKLTAFRAREMGFVFQTYNLLPVLTAIENVELPLLVNGIRTKAARLQALSELAAVGLEDWALHRPSELSGGQQQRVAIARALVTRPSIVWADEPTGALDSKISQEIIDLMLQLNRERQLTFIWVTHALEVAQQAQRLITMKDGSIIQDRTLCTTVNPLHSTSQMLSNK